MIHLLKYFTLYIREMILLTGNFLITKMPDYSRFEYTCMKITGKHLHDLITHACRHVTRMVQ